MKKITAIFLSIVMAVSLSACGGVSEDADKYIAYSVTMLGIDIDPSELYDEDIVLALDENGKAMLALDGEEYNCKWAVDGEDFTLSQGKDEFTGTMIGDVVTIVNMLDTGLDISFLIEGAPLPIDTSKPMGNYLLSGMDMDGIRMVYADIQMTELDISLAFKEDGTVEMSSNGEVLALSIDYEAKTVDIDGVVSDFTFEDEQFTIISEEEGMTMQMFFTAEASEKWGEITAEESTIADGFGDMPSGIDFVAPGYGSAVTVPVDTLSNPSDWYGTVTITLYDGPYAADMIGEHEAWGYIGNDGTDDYFEIYVDGIYEEGSVAVLSFYADFADDTFFPIVDGSDWIFDTTLIETDAEFYAPSIINGVLTATYDYADEDESFMFTYELAMIEDSDIAVG